MAEDSFNERYYRLLKDYVASGSEEQLAVASDMGRELVQAEVPPEVIGEAHAETVARLAEETPGWLVSESVPIVSVPLLEMLMAYGLAFRGMLEERQRAEDELRKSEERSRLIIETAYDAFVSIDQEGRITAWNAQAEAMFGWPRSEASGLRFAETILPESDRQTFEQALEAMMATGEGLNERREVTGLRRDGREFAAELVFWAGRSGEDGTLNAFIRDISERKRYEAQLAHAASHDPLTNLCNRRRFEEELERELARARRYGACGALLFMDLDQFKDVNDSLGHQAGDELLIRLAGLLKESLRETDTIARLGGDEFAVLLGSADAERASIVAEKLLRSLRDCRFVLSGREVRASASIGIATFPEPGLTVEELLSRADLAMYQAKEQGRDRYCVFTPDKDWQAQTEARLAWRSQILEALEEDRFLLYAQPVLDLAHNEVSHHEVLLRMKGEDGEIMLPGTFLGFADRSGLRQEIERWVVRRTVRLIAEHRRKDREPFLAAGLSAGALTDQELLPLVRQELAERGVQPSSLILELPESAVVENITGARQFADDLKEVGCRLALDGFGTGVSSFTLLKHLSADFLKIDGSLIDGLARSPTDQHLLRAIVDIARGLGMKTIADHVGDEETAALLRDYGVDYGQGEHAGRVGEAPDVLSRAAEASHHAA